MGLVRKRQSKVWLGFAAAISALGPAACSVGPDYLRPSAPEPLAYKELKGWKRATPRDESDRGPWWSVFKDEKLNSFEPQVEISNQTVAADEAAYRQTLAVIKEAQAGLFPAVTLNYSYIGSHFGAEAIGNALGTGTTKTVYTLASNGSWDLDLWGKIRRTVESDVAGAQVSAADLANAKLSAQAMLATAYYNLREADALQVLLDRTVVYYKKTLAITQHQYDAGTASQADVATARTQVLTTQSQAINVGVMRAQFEHAIAVLMGKTPAELTIAPTPLGFKDSRHSGECAFDIVGKASGYCRGRTDDAARERAHWRRRRPLLPRHQPYRHVRVHRNRGAYGRTCQRNV